MKGKRKKEKDKWMMSAFLPGQDMNIYY